jgi:phosphoserine phosphatase RsbU/P
MSQLSEIRTQLGKFEEYERELHLKQLQINNLLSITQAINSNHSAAEIFLMYHNFLDFTMSIKKMALYFLEDDKWQCVCNIGLTDEVAAIDATDILKDFRRMMNVTQKDHPLLEHFDNNIPVFHKYNPIAHVLLGGFDEKEDRYNKIQFITALTNVIAVAIENKRLFKRQIEQERLTQEMQLAKQMQLSLVPSKMPKGTKYEVASVYLPHLSVGGDLYDFVQFDNKERLICCIADIAGKGLAAALLMANFQANLRSIIRRRGTPDAFIRMLNKAIYRITEGDRYITFFIAEFDQRTRMLRYINAGHTPPFLYSNGNIEALTEGCTFLGWMEEIPMDIGIGEVHIPDDALLVCFTDGITDVCNPVGTLFSEEGLSSFITQTGMCNAADFNQKLLAHLNDFRVKEDYTDDFTLVTLRLFA